MKRIVAIYRSRKAAFEALRKLKDHHFSSGKMTISEEGVESDHGFQSVLREYPNAPVLIGICVGAVIGLMIGLGFIQLSGVFINLTGAGALVGALAGFTFGLIIGGAITMYVTVAYPKNQAAEFGNESMRGEFDIFLDGDEKDVMKARSILGLRGTPFAPA